MLAALLKLDLASVVLTLFLGLIFLVLFEIFRINSYKRRFPPGPTPLPFVGNLPQLLKYPMGFKRSLSQYGEMATVFIGRKPAISINTIQLAKEALVQDVFSGRPPMPIFDWISYGLGIVMVTFNHSWRQQRRFALHTLRNFGLGKKTVEDRVIEESQYLIAEILKDEGKSMNPQHALQNAVSNIICSIVFGDRFEYDNKRFEYLLKILNENIMLTGSAAGQIFNLVPFIKHFPGPHQKVKQNANDLFGFIREEAKEHRQTLDPDSPRDFIDAYLLEIEKQKTKKDSTFHEEHLVVSAGDLFLAGTDTTETTIRWGLIYLIQNPDVQERCHEEIVQVLGYDRLPSMDDRDRLPYTHATVHEIQRCGNITPKLIHETIRRTKLHGYDIPQTFFRINHSDVDIEVFSPGASCINAAYAQKICVRQISHSLLDLLTRKLKRECALVHANFTSDGTTIIANFTAIFSNKEHWKHPDSFNPENFLDENGHFSKPEFFFPFSLGPRACLGETLARTELFLFITSLLQRICFSWPPNAKPIDMDGIVGIVRSPETFNIICHSRNTKD